jgi:cysteine-rich repeat protein
VCATQCGDGIVAGAEQCDDQKPGGGCTDDTCQVVSGWTCDNSREPSDCHTICHDGIVTPPEECDDGGACTTEPYTRCTTDSQCSSGGTCEPQGGDGCSAKCMVETAFACDIKQVPSVCTPIHCNFNSVVDSFEQCDDGNHVATDDCTNDCTLNQCGDGIVHLTHSHP